MVEVKVHSVRMCALSTTHFQCSRSVNSVTSDNIRGGVCIYSKYSLTDFQNYFTVTLIRKVEIKWSLQIPPHLNGVATLPYEVLMSDNIVSYVLGHCFLKYILARDMT